MPKPTESGDTMEVWERQLGELLDAHPGHGGKSVLAREIGVTRQLLNMWLPMRATGKPRQAPNYYNRIRIQEAWERIIGTRQSGG